MADRLSAAAPSLADFEAMMRRAFDRLPAQVRRACADLLLRVADFAPDDVLDEMEVEDPYELTGLYDGVALTERSVMMQPDRPDAVWLYRRPILEEWIDRGDVELDRLVGTSSCTRSPTTSAGPTTTSAPWTTGPSRPGSSASPHRPAGVAARRHPDVAA